MTLSPEKIHLCDRSLCTGCMSCRQVCKAGAISEKNIDGFSYPDINRDVCKACGLCMNVCPVLNLNGQKGNCHEYTHTCLAAWNKSDEVRMNSSSGGVFSALAEYIISQNGIVFGAAWQSDLKLVHTHIDCIQDLDILRRSKYVQSDVGDSYKQTKFFLQQGKIVLFSGTPCQIAGLHAFLGKPYERLYTLDVLCQGVPSQDIFRKYVLEYEHLHKSKVVDCNFRSKVRGWRCGLLLQLQTTKGKKYCYLNKNEYYNAFVKEFFLRDSCYSCRFKEHDLGYFSDLTIADFWRIGNNEKFEIDDYEKGVSALIVNTEKGKRLLDLISEKIYMSERTWNEFATNGGLYCSTRPSKNKDAFEFLKSNSWRQTQKKFFPLSNKAYISDLKWLVFGERNVRRFSKMKKFIKKLLGN